MVNSGGTPGDSGTQNCATGAPASRGTCQFTFDVTTVTARGGYAPANVGAIWIADAQGTFVKTLEAWGTTRLSNAAAWESASAGNTVDAVTGATRTDHGPHHVTWNCTDTAEAPVPDSDYTVNVTFAESSYFPFFSPPAIEATVPFTRGPCAIDITAPDAPNFTNMRVTLQ
jgi:hypothetical protein